MPVNNLARHTHNGTDTPKINFDDLTNTPSIIADLANANPPLAEVTAPSGGVTVDSQARSAINTIIDRLETLGFIEEN